MARDYKCSVIQTITLGLITAEYSNQRTDASTIALGGIIFSGKNTSIATRSCTRRTKKKSGNDWPRLMPDWAINHL